MIAGLGQAQEQSSDGQSYGNNNDQQMKSIWPTFRVQIVEDPAEEAASKRSEEESRQREIRDLAAQEGVNTATQSMNAATQAMRNYAFYSTILAVVGTFLIAWATWMNAKATRAATEATAIMRQEQRPWLYIDIGNRFYIERGARPENTFISIQINITNYGNTPNSRGIVRYRIIPFTGSGDLGEIFKDMRADKGGLGVMSNVRPIFRGQTDKVMPNVFLTSDEVDRVIGGNCLLLVLLRYGASQASASKTDYFYVDRCFTLKCDKNFGTGDDGFGSTEGTINDVDIIRAFEGQ